MNPQDPQALAAENQVLRGRILQLEAELERVTHVADTVCFVGSQVGWNNWTGGIDSREPNVSNAAATARNKANAEFTAWKAANPAAIVLSKQLSWTGLDAVIFANTHIFMGPTLTITVQYRLP